MNEFQFIHICLLPLDQHKNAQYMADPPAEEAGAPPAGVGRAGREGPAPAPRGGRLGPLLPPGDGAAAAAGEEAPPAWGRAGRDGIAPPAHRGTVTMLKRIWNFSIETSVHRRNRVPCSLIEIVCRGKMVIKALIKTM